MDPNTRLPLRTGNEMPVLGLGTWQLTRDTDGAVAHALELGYRMIDTAEDYGTQPAIAEAVARSGLDRDEFYIVTKVEEIDDAYAAARDYLRELRLDHADLILIHRPPPSGAGEELWRGLIRARDEGLARDIGVSNYSADLIDALIAATDEVPAVNQVEWSPFGHSDDMLRYARDKDMVIQAYSPLTRARRLDDARLAETAARYGKSPAQILIRWNLQRGTVPLPKASQGAHREENFDVFNFAIDDDDMAALDHLNEHYSSLGTLPYL